MRKISRRLAVQSALAGALTGYWATGKLEAQQASGERSVEQWMEEWIEAARTSPDALHVTRFREPIYILTKPIRWVPEAAQKDKFREVEVPRGFVTDFASIPRAFWSLLRPDGEYTYPAIVHDYIYWVQDRPRESADEIFKLGMQEFGIAPATLNIIYGSVVAAGKSAWDGNTKLKGGGEKRLLKQFPENAKVSWVEFKKRPGVFAD